MSNATALHFEQPSEPPFSTEESYAVDVNVDIRKARYIGEEEYACWLLKKAHERTLDESEREWLDAHIARCRGRVQEKPRGVIVLKLAGILWFLAIIATLAFAASGWK